MNNNVEYNIQRRNYNIDNKQQTTMNYLHASKWPVRPIGLVIFKKKIQTNSESKTIKLIRPEDYIWSMLERAPPPTPTHRTTQINYYEPVLSFQKLLATRPRSVRMDKQNSNKDVVELTSHWNNLMSWRDCLMRPITLTPS